MRAMKLMLPAGILMAGFILCTTASYGKPEYAKKFFAQAQADAERRWKFYQFMAGRNLKAETAPAPAAKPAATVDQQP